MKNRIMTNSAHEIGRDLKKSNQIFSAITTSRLFSPVATSFLSAILGFVFFIVQENYISSMENYNNEAKIKTEFKIGEIECLINIDDAFQSLLNKPDSKELDSALTMHLISHKKFINKQRAIMLSLQSGIDTSIITEVNKYHELISNIQFDLSLNEGGLDSGMYENVRIIYEEIIFKLQTL